MMREKSDNSLFLPSSGQSKTGIKCSRKQKRSSVSLRLWG